MKALTLNLATRPFRNNTAVGSAVAAVAAALILATGYNLYVFLNYGNSYQKLLRGEREDRARLSTLDQKERALAKEIQARDFKRLYERGKFANDLILRRSFSWTLLFNTLESVVPPEVMMTSIRPSVKDAGTVILVQGLAKSSDALHSFEERLLKNPVFLQVYPGTERKLNPSRPDIAFTLNFDYVPRPAVPPAAVVAAASTPPAAARPVTAAPPAATPAAAPAPSPAPSPAPDHAPRPAIGTVGRDGRPRIPEAQARLVAAPGAIYVPPAAAAEARKPAGGKGRPGAQGIPEDRPAGTQGPAASGPAPAPTGSVAPAGTSAQAPPGGAQAAVPGPVSAAIRQGGRVWGVPVKDAAPAVRLDVRLDFAGRPVSEIYEALARAHGVQFEVDGGVDGRAPVTASLAGRSLDDAIAVLSRAAGHRVTRLGDRLYKVAAVAGGEPLADKPIHEENLAPVGGRP